MLLMEKLSNNIADGIAARIECDDNQREVIAYGAYVLFDMLLSIGMVMMFGALLGVFLPALVISFVSAMLRRSSGGAHAETSLRCAAIGTLISVGFAVVIERMSVHFCVHYISAYFMVAFLISYMILYKLAPVDSPNKRIVKEHKIRELKQNAIRLLVIYSVICVLAIIAGGLYNINVLLKYAALICTGFFWQSFTLTSLGHTVSNILEMPFGYKKLLGGEKG